VALGTISFRNSVLEQTEPLSVILPEPDVGLGPFPVLYLLHGMGDDHTTWVRMTSIERYVKSMPLIVVMPMTQWRSMYVDSLDGPKSASCIAQGLIDFIDSRLNTRPERAYRAVCGLSMGGYGAFHLALSFPERFGAAVSHSGVLLFGHVNVEDYPPDERGARMRAITERTVGPSPKGGPADLFTAAECLPADLRPVLRFDCGTEDFLLEHNRAFHKHLERIGYDHEYVEHPGSHTWDYWDEHIKDSIDFFVRKLGWPAAIS
jgi:putative tributyrin esterase